MTRALLGVTAVVLLLGGCVIPGTEDTTGNTLDVERENRVEGDVEVNVGEDAEVYGVTATVLEVGRVDAYDELDNWGYIWARVRVENTTSREIDFHRRQFRLEKPDGSLSNTANISSQTQIEGGTTTRSDRLAPGTSREGLVIYTVGDLEGQFAMVYLPESPTDDPLDRQRGVWVFESSLEDIE